MGRHAIDSYLILPGAAPLRLDPTGSCVVGRDAGCHLVLNGSGISRRHARLDPDPDGHWRLTDLDSANGCRVEDEPLLGAHRLCDGERIRIGDQELVYRLLPAGAEAVDLAAFEQRRSVSVPTIDWVATGATPSFTGSLRSSSLRELCRSLLLTGKTGRLQIDDDIGRQIWFVDGVPRQAVCRAQHGLLGLVHLLRIPGLHGYAFFEGERCSFQEPIAGTAETILEAVFGVGGSHGDLVRAEDLQKHLLAQLPELPGYEVEVGYRGLGGVSGDIYDVGTMADGRYLLTVGDVSGHGVQGALVVAGLLKALRLLRRQHRRIEDLLVALNDDLCGDLLPEQFCTLFAAALDPSSGRLEVVLAGHHPALLCRSDGSVHQLGRPGLALGLVPSAPFAASLNVDRGELAPGECLVQCSDGLIEATVAGRQLGLDGLQAHLADDRGAATASARDLTADLQDLVLGGGVQQVDDLTILVLRRPNGRSRVSPSGADVLRRTTEVPLGDAAQPSARAFTGDALLPRRFIASLGDDSSAADADYRLVDRLGRGGLGEVYLAEQRGLDRAVALKRLLADGVSGDEAQAKFLIEARVTAALDHPHIVPVHDLGYDSKHGVFYTMKRELGDTWAVRMSQLGQWENVAILLKVCDAIAFAHSRGVIHRDLKPENILLGHFGEVTVVDWGVAAYVGPSDGPLAAVVPPPRSGLAVGTPAYMAPEAARGEAERIGFATDVYLLGGLLAELVTGDAPHHGADPRACIAAAAANDLAVAAGGDPGLLTIARRALASDPLERHDSVAAFRRELVEHQIHRESLALTEQARLHLDRALRGGAYADCLKATTAAEHALELWGDNLAARTLLQRARLQHGETALARGDLDLAESVLGEVLADDADLRRRIAAAREQRTAQRAAAQRLEALQERLRRETERRWLPVFRAEPSPTGLERDWECSGGEVTARDGALVMRGGAPQIALLRQRLAGDLRIRFVAWQEGSYVNDLTVFFAATGQSAAQRMLDTGYQVKYGCYDNTLNLIIRSGRRLVTSAASPWVAGRRSRFEIERIGGIIVVRVDGETVQAVEDPEPLGGSECDRLGIAGWLAETHIVGLTIDQLGKPILANLLETAQRHQQLGHYRTAEDLYLDVLQSDADGDGRRAAERGLEQVRAAAALGEQLPAIAERLRRTWPRVEVGQSGPGLEVDIADQQVADLAPISGLPVVKLVANDNRIASLEPLRGMDVRVLQVGGNRIADLTPLSGMPLEMVVLRGNRIVDLAPLAGGSLTMLLAADNRLSDLGPLAGSAVSTLDVQGNPELVDLTPLASLRLTSLCLHNTGVQDLAPLRGMGSLSILLLDRTGVLDLQPLTGLPLNRLCLSGTGVRDVGPLHESRLQILTLCHTRVGDLSPLAGLPLDVLDLRGAAVRGPGPCRWLVERVPGLWVRPGISYSGG